MKTIGIISDTHGHLDQNMMHNLETCDEIWHAGDFGQIGVYDALKELKPLRGVYGNIDGHELRLCNPETQMFKCEGFRILMTHIGGYPGRYDKRILADLNSFNPEIFISGHSHILKVLPDNKRNLLHINPGAAGYYGFHKTKTMVILVLNNHKILDIKAIELGPRSAGTGLNLPT